MCRIVTAGFAEDVNHTHPHRAHDASFVPGTKDSFDGNDKASYEFRNGTAAELDGERYTIPESATLPGGDDAYKKVLKESDAGRLTQYEPVPRFRKRPGDFVIEGTNNATIVLGRDRTGQVAAYKIDELKGQVPSIPDDDVQIDGAACIDLVVGRGQTPQTGGSVVDNDIDSKELGKSTKELETKEGDPDFFNDRTRLLLSQRTPVDKNFGLNVFNKEFADGTIQGHANERVGITDDQTSAPNGDGAAVIKSDKIRLIARSDIEILVTGFERDENGLMKSTTDPDNYCAIVLKANGDIVLRPAKTGFIKLGGDDADKGIVCTDLPVIAKDGIVAGAPLTSTMGGQIAGSVGDKGALAPGQGRFASRVLIK
jgi:hypothetical protein